jgi:hypothetical protein
MYVSMTCLILVLFFSLTGITLNHPEWTFGIKDVRKNFEGKLATGAIAGDKVDWLKVVEQLRVEHPIKGAASDMRVDGDEGSLSFKAPGYSAECFFKMADGRYQLSITTQGVVAVINDLHRGNNSGQAWSWLVDMSGVALAFMALTGIGIMFYLKKSRVPAFTLCAIGLIVFSVMVAAASR